MSNYTTKNLSIVTYVNFNDKVYGQATQEPKNVETQTFVLKEENLEADLAEFKADAHRLLDIQLRHIALQATFDLTGDADRARNVNASIRQ